MLCLIVLNVCVDASGKAACTLQPCLDQAPELLHRRLSPAELDILRFVRLNGSNGTFHGKGWNREINAELCRNDPQVAHVDVFNVSPVNVERLDLALAIYAVHLYPVVPIRLVGGQEYVSNLWNIGYFNTSLLVFLTFIKVRLYQRDISSLYNSSKKETKTSLIRYSN